VTKEVDMSVTAPFLLVNPDFSKTEVVKAYAHTIVAPAIDYWKQTIEGKKGDQLERMKAVRIFNPLHVLGNKISESDIGGLKIFKFHDHPEIRPQIEVMKTEVMKYQALAGSIKSFEERKDSKGKDTFDLSDWWKSNCATLPGFAYVLRVVLTNSPNRQTSPAVVQCLDRGGRAGMVEGVGVWYLYEIALWLHAGNILRHTFRNH